MQALGAALIASLLGKCCCTARAAACPQAPGAQFAMYREVRDLDKKGLCWWRSSIRPHRGPISGGGVVFCVSLLLCFLPNSDGLSDDDDPRLAGGQLELLQSMPNVASVMCSPPYLSTPCPPVPPAVTLDGRKRDGNFTNIQYMVILSISTGNQTHTRLCRLSGAT